MAKAKAAFTITVTTAKPVKSSVIARHLRDVLTSSFVTSTELIEKVTVAPIGEK